MTEICFTHQIPTHTNKNFLWDLHRSEGRFPLNIMSGLHNLGFNCYMPNRNSTIFKFGDTVPFIPTNKTEYDFTFSFNQTDLVSRLVAKKYFIMNQNGMQKIMYLDHIDDKKNNFVSHLWNVLSG